MAKWIVRVPGRYDQRCTSLIEAKKWVKRMFTNSLTGERVANKVYLVRVTEDVTSVTPEEVADGSFDKCFPDDME